MKDSQYRSTLSPNTSKNFEVLRCHHFNAAKQSLNLSAISGKYCGGAYQNLPKCIEVDVAAYWLIPRFFTWFEALLLKNISPFFNLYQIVIIKIPRNLTKSCDFVVCKDIGIGPSQSIHVEKRDCTVIQGSYLT